MRRLYLPTMSGHHPDFGKWQWAKIMSLIQRNIQLVIISILIITKAIYSYPGKLILPSLFLLPTWIIIKN